MDPCYDLLVQLQSRQDRLHSTAVSFLCSTPHLVHTKLADGRPGPKIKLNAIDGDNADFQAKNLIGQKPYRGHTIEKIEKIEKKVNESAMDKYVDAIGGNVFGKLAR